MKSLILTPHLQQALIDGRKTQTRRLLGSNHLTEADMSEEKIIRFLTQFEAKYQVNDILYLRESFRLPALVDNLSPKKVEASPVEFRLGGAINCVGDHIKEPGRWRSPLHLPENLARTFVRIMDVKVERLNDITYEDAMQEGVAYKDSGCGIYYMDYLIGDYCRMYRADSSFESLWQSIYGADSWDKNSWVFAYTFELCDRHGNALTSKN